MDLRQHILSEFNRVKNEGKNIIDITSSIEELFHKISNPNEFAGPLVEAWMHINFERSFDVYESAISGSQSFADAKIQFQNMDVLLNIKAKEKGKIDRSRINLSSFNRYSMHYSKESCEPYYIVLFQYSWKAYPKNLMIQIDELLYCFDLLEIPKENLKIEGASEGSFRIFISPIPDIAKTTQGVQNTRFQTISKYQPNEFVRIITELKSKYSTRKETTNSRRR